MTRADFEWHFFYYFRIKQFLLTLQYMIKNSEKCFKTRSELMVYSITGNFHIKAGKLEQIGPKVNWIGINGDTSVQKQNVLINSSWSHLVTI